MASIQKIFSHLVGLGKIPTETTLISNQSVSGGDINKAFKLETSSGWYFLKINSTKKGNLFECEEAGLLALKKSGTLSVANIIGQGKIENSIYLALEWVEEKNPKAEFWTLFGERLAQMHKCSHEFFGFNSANYIGSLPQQNNWNKSWTEFFVLERMEPMVKKAFDLNLLSKKHLNAFNGLYTQVEQLFPTSKPSLLHGDLWSGNFICSNQKPVLIDPAVYYGHHEMELAFTKVFGGFHPLFYESYENTQPLEKGFNNRMPIYNLYPNLVHLILFGSTYLPAINKTIEPFKTRSQLKD